MALSDQQRLELDLAMPPDVWDMDEGQDPVALFRIIYFWAYRAGTLDALAKKPWALMERLGYERKDPL